MKKQYKEINFSKPRAEMISIINSVLAQYEDRLTLRQLYYQLVSRNIIKNDDKEYKKISALLTDARMAGLVDWEAIEDRVRVPKLAWSADGVRDAMQAVMRQYRRDRMEGQSTYIEVWLEKDALSSIVGKVCNKYHIRLMVNRGYSSCSAMYEAAYRFRNYGKGKRKVILYLGDHDPSGLDMIRDVRDRMVEFGITDINVEPIALTMEQIEEYGPPPNPAKLKDVRSTKYVEEHGYESWELDALQPEELTAIVEVAVEGYVDEVQYERMLKIEKEDKDAMSDFVDTYEN